MASRALIGRGTELAAVAPFLAGIARGPAALVLVGEAGIGKTVLWEAGVEEARPGVAHILTCRAAEAEASLSFAGLSDLLGGVLDDVLPLLVAPRRRALEVALLLAESGEKGPDAHAIGLAVLDLLRALAARGPVLIALDDLQWLDPASSAVLQIALRRLRDEPVGLLATVRPTSSRGPALDLERSFPHERLTVLALEPLRAAALHHLLREVLGVELSRSELTRVHATCHGNPYFAIEVGRELARTPTTPGVRRALRVPDSLHELLGTRLAQLPLDGADVLLYVSALARPTIGLVAAARGAAAGVEETLAAAVAHGIIEVEEPRIRFAHPLLATVCYERATPSKRRAVHRILAGVVPELEERARHLALAAERPDAATASELDAAAGRAASRGAPAAAAELCELAAELTPGDPARARQRRLRSAGFHRLAGDVDHAAALLEQLLSEAPAGTERADILLGLVMTQRADTPKLFEFYEQALREAADDDARSARILSWRMGAHLYAGDGRAALADAREALQKAERAGDPFLLALAIARTGQAEAYAVDITPGLLERGAAIEEGLGVALEYNESPRYALARLLARMGELERARTLLADLEAQSLESGDESSRVMVLWMLSIVEWLAGRWRRALELATEAYELTEQTQHPQARTWVGRAKALIEADLGLVDEARASAAECLAYCRESSKHAATIFTTAVLGRLELGLGNVEAAGDHLRELPAALLAGGMIDPAQPVWADSIETLITLGELERAGAYLAQFEVGAQRLGSPLAKEAVHRCRALLTGASGDAAGGAAVLERALADEPEPPWPFERARTLLCLGSLRRKNKQKRAARNALEQARAIFEDLGAPLWAERARAELRRIGGRGPASMELTETETRVAALAGAGRSNKQIAAELFMSVHTVAAHLTHVYRKLGVHSRAQLSARLAAAAVRPHDSRDMRAIPASEATKV
jgi:DNA-binding CsgD family transcriptional regulator